MPEGFVLKIGRFTDKQALPNRVTFKSKVVSRGHAEIFTENGKVSSKTRTLPNFDDVLVTLQSVESEQGSG